MTWTRHENGAGATPTFRRRRRRGGGGDAQLFAKLLMRKDWQEIWNCCDGNNLHVINPTVCVNKRNDSRSRRDVVILNRLQIGHTRATHAHLLGDDETFCATCYTSLTVNHILIECPQFNHLRQQYHFGSTLKELFSNTSVNELLLSKIPIFILAYNRCCTCFILAI